MTSERVRMQSMDPVRCSQKLLLPNSYWDVATYARVSTLIKCCCGTLTTPPLGSNASSCWIHTSQGLCVQDRVHGQ